MAELRELLTGHVSPATAYVVDDYPYGFRLRCKIRYWIETTKHGMRFVSNTTNPKRPGEHWNKPKASTYSAVLVMGLDEVGHVTTHGLSGYSSAEAIENFAVTYAAALTGDYERAALRRLRVVSAAGKHLTYHIVGPGDERNTPADEARILTLAYSRGEREVAARELEPS